MECQSFQEESYNNVLKNTDLEQFKVFIEEISSLIQNPIAKDNQKHELFTLLAIIFCAIVGGQTVLIVMLWLKRNG